MSTWVLEVQPIQKDIELHLNFSEIIIVPTVQLCQARWLLQFITMTIIRILRHSLFDVPVKPLELILIFKTFGIPPECHPWMTQSQLYYNIATYQVIVELTNNTNGYTGAYQTCCRITPMENVFTVAPPGQGEGTTYVCTIPGTSQFAGRNKLQCQDSYNGTPCL